MTDATLNAAHADQLLNAPPGGPAVVTPPVTPPLIAPVAPVVAPVVAPATPAAVTFEPTGDVSLDVALNFLGAQGLTLESPELIEAGKGNFQYLEGKFAAMGDKAPAGWREHVNMAKEAHTRIEKRNNDEYVALEKSIHDAVGGPETWAAVTKYAQDTYAKDSTERAEIADTLNAGGLGAIAMAQFLHNQALASTRATNVPGAAAVDTTTVTNTQVGSMARITDQATFKAEQRKLIAQFGMSAYDKTPEWQALTARRAF